MIILVKIGFLLVATSVILAVYTGNLFGFSKKQNNIHSELKARQHLSSSEREKLRYFTINEFIRYLWKIIFVFGVALSAVGLLI